MPESQKNENLYKDSPNVITHITREHAASWKPDTGILADNTATWCGRPLRLTP